MVNLDVSIKSKTYSGHAQRALGTLQFNVKKTEFVAIVGPSGTGKSTLLNMISGLESCHDGEILFDGFPQQGNADCDISYIFQQPRLMPWLSVQDNLWLVKPDASALEIEDLLTKVGLEGKGKHYPKQLSGGMQRRVSIARAFLTNPQLLLLDEPFISLDAPNADRLRVLLSNLWQDQQPTILFVTHDLTEAIQLADRILFLSSAPGAVILDQVVDLPRPRLIHDKTLQDWKAQLLFQNPGLLEGEICKTALNTIAGGIAC